MPQRDRSAQTAAYLRMLLARPGGPRSAWEKLARDARPGEIDSAAVLEVLSRAAASEIEPGADLPGIVRGALDGSSLSAAGLAAFIDAFDIGQRHAGRLRDLLNGSDAVRVITGAELNDLHRQVG